MTTSHTVSAYEIADAWDAVTESVHDYRKTHPDLRWREDERLQRVFVELADLLVRSRESQSDEDVAK